MEVVVKNIDKYCADRGLNTIQFERLCKIAHSSVGKWKRGIASPSVRTLEKISKATNIPIEDWLKSEGA
jgi:transcriptional regulator with XRE-family HTH domain